MGNSASEIPAATMRRGYGPGGAIVADKCACGLTLDPPLDQDYWGPSLDPPEDSLHTVVRHTDTPVVDDPFGKA